MVEPKVDEFIARLAKTIKDTVRAEVRTELGHYDRIRFPEYQPSSFPQGGLTATSSSAPETSPASQSKEAPTPASGSSPEPSSGPTMRTFATGATRNRNENKLSYYGFFSPRVLRGFAQYMHKNRRQADGSMRTPDNWKKGIPIEAYHDSFIRHVHEYWERNEHEFNADALTTETLHAIMFNVMGLLYEADRNRKE